MLASQMNNWCTSPLSLSQVLVPSRGSLEQFGSPVASNAIWQSIWGAELFSQLPFVLFDSFSLLSCAG